MEGAKEMKKRKRVSVFALLLTLLFILQATIVLADIQDSLTKTLNTLDGPLVWLWDIMPAHPSFPFIIKTLYFFIIFAASYNGLMFALKSKMGDDGGPLKKAIMVITLSFSIIAAWGMPIDWLLMIFAWNTAILSIVFAMLIPICMFFIAKRVFPGDEGGNPVFRGILWLFMGLFMMGLAGFLLENPNADFEIYETFLSWIQIFGVIAIFAGLFQLMMGMGGKALGGKAWNGMKGLLNRGGSSDGSSGGSGSGDGSGNDSRNTNGGNTDGGGTTPTTPANPRQIRNLVAQMQAFNGAVGQPPTPATTSLLGQAEAANTLHTGTPITGGTAVTRRTSAQARIPSLDRLRTEVGNQRTVMDSILNNNQYGNVDDADRTVFENHIAIFVAVERVLTRIYLETIIHL
jgi:hypothetical protein